MVHGSVEPFLKTPRDMNCWLRISLCVRRLEAPRHQPDLVSHLWYNRRMRTVNISDLKARLSAHIQFVREGQEVLVCDRNQPVARIVPIRSEDLTEQEKRLIARGILTPPRKPRSRSRSWPKPPGNVSADVMEQVWREEREGR
jgi:prevent-host-death family protein